MSDRRSEELRQQGIQLLRQNDPEAALEVFSRGLDVETEEAQSQRLKAHMCMTLVALDRLEDPLFSDLPKIVLRRTDSFSVYLASYALSNRHRALQRFDRASHYARLAYDAALELDNPIWVIDSLVERGNVAVLDSRFEEALEHYRDATERLGESQDGLRRAFILQNVGYCKLVTGDAEAALPSLKAALRTMHDSGVTQFIAESHLDLALAHQELGNLDLALDHGEAGLEHATELRQERNAHYLLGEIHFALGNREAAESHFDHLCRHYPDFPQLKNLLYALDLKKVINWKL